MPRVAGRIDLTKSEAILDAASDLLAERGLSASLEEIARRARVSKQTIYNHYGSKAELIRALVDRRVEEIIAPLEERQALARPEAALAGFARVMLEAVLSPRGVAFMRLYIEGAADMPELARNVFEAGPKTSRARLARFLQAETAAGRLAVDDPALAAEFFAGMVTGSHQTALLLGVDPGLTAERLEHIAQEAARRFMRAYRA